jgi:NADPH-dependent ferric siderophore reductase
MDELMKHTATRVRHELARRNLTVVKIEQISPGIRRLILGGDALAGFTSMSPDDHIKIMLPSEGDRPLMRDYTPRRYDAARQELTVDFAMHDSGPVTQWASNAQAGDTIEVGGPRGSMILADDFDWWLMIGDETGLPSIGRRVEEMRSGLPVTTIVTVEHAADEQTLETAARHEARWVHREGRSATDPAQLIEAIRQFTPPAGDGFVWIGAEAGVAKALRNLIVEELKWPNVWIKASGYWLAGQADSSDKPDVESTAG